VKRRQFLKDGALGVGATALAGGSGLTVRSYQDVICVNQWGRRFWNELDDTYGFLNACLSRHENNGKSGKANGGGPIWAVFDAEAVVREGWDPRPPHVDPNGWFYSADTIAELARKIANPYQLQPMPPGALEETITGYNSYVDAGKDPEFGRLGLMFQDPEAAVLCGVGHADPETTASSR
jgi:hypothetical protein